MNKVLATDLDIISTFRRSFIHYINEPIILYGIGEKTKVLVENLSDFNFAGLMDKSSAGYRIYDVDVINTAEAEFYRLYLPF